MKTSKEIENCLESELKNMVWELENETLTEELLYHYFRQFLCDAQVDSKITVNVLEKCGDLGKEEARSIKVYEGW